MAATPTFVSEMLGEYGALTQKHLPKYLPNQEPRQYLYDLVADYPSRGGKMMRPSICIAATRACGGETEDALNSAVSIELLHNAMLIHDDIEDESLERRGKPTLHERTNIPLALNAGDMLGILSFRPLLENSTRLGTQLTQRIVLEAERVCCESAEGQALELGWRATNNFAVSECDYLEMVLKKTCWLATIYPLRLGALIGSRGRIDIDRFIRFGYLLGAAFQIQDDLLNLFQDERYGKEHIGDLWEAKRTLMLIHLLHHCSKTQRIEIESCLSKTRTDKNQSDLESIRQMMDHHGSIDYGLQVAQGIAGAARSEFDSAFAGLPASRDLEFLRSLTTWVFERN